MSAARAARLVYARELRETLRDRRTLAVMVLFPLVVYPLMALIAAQIAQTRATGLHATPSRVAVAEPSTARAQQVREVLKSLPRVKLVEGDADANALTAGRVDAVVQGRPGSTTLGHELVSVLHDSTRDESRLASDRVEQALERALPAGCVARFDVASQDVARPERRGGYVASRALPLVLVLMVMLGAFYPAIDSTAGERERGTIETTLVLPLPRGALLVGKVLAVATLALITGLLNLASMALTLVQAVQIAQPQAMDPLPWGRIALAATLTIPAAAFFASLMVAVGAAARSFKEAQNLMTPMHVLLFAPAMVGAIGELKLGTLAALVPSLGLTLLARDIVQGVARPVTAVTTIGITLAYTALSVTLAARMFQPERLLAIGDATVRRWRWRFPLGRTTATAGPAVTAGEAMALFAVGFVVLILFIPWQARDLVSGLLASEWLGLFGLVVVFARLKRRRVADVLVFGRPTWQALVGAAVMGASAWVAVALLSQAVLPAPKEVLEQLKRTFVPEAGPRPLALNLFLVAITPAICEEALFRGAILRGLLTRMSRWGAILLCGVLFCLYHMNLYRLLPTAMLGVMLSWLAVVTGSIIPGMIAHAVSNGLLVTLATLYPEDAMAVMSLTSQIVAASASLVVVTFGVWLVRRGKQVRHQV